MVVYQLDGQGTVDDIIKDIENDIKLKEKIFSSILSTHINRKWCYFYTLF
ncbi:hypothetical protein HMPREF9992_02377 [Staphylococcus epidermidis NIHLM070]|nr:hypothetical protein HMPREF9992_02377 [Staphylococcus epidermidis NIHLM070]